MQGSTTVYTLATELRSRGYRVYVVPADPPHNLTPAVNVWSNKSDTYPWTSVWAPRSDVPGAWTWGPNYEHEAAPDTSTSGLADLVEASIPKDTP